MEIRAQIHIDEVIAAESEAVQKALETIGLIAEGYAKIECPVDTGNLRNSITHQRGDNYVAIGTNVEYAPYVEMGTSRMKAQPYLRPAVDEHLTEYEQIIKSSLQAQP